MLGVLLEMEELEQAAEVEGGLGAWAFQREEERLQAKDVEETGQVWRGQEGWLEVKTAEPEVSEVEMGCPPAQEGVRGERVEEEVVERVKTKMQGMTEREVEVIVELLLDKLLLASLQRKKNIHQVDNHTTNVNNYTNVFSALMWLHS